MRLLFLLVCAGLAAAQPRKRRRPQHPLPGRQGRAHGPRRRPTRGATSNSPRVQEPTWYCRRPRRAQVSRHVVYRAVGMVQPVGDLVQALPTRDAVLLGWRDRLRQDGVALDVWFLSLDEDADELAKFLAAHPDVAPAPSLRASDPADFRAWVKNYTFDGSMPIPITFWQRPTAGSVACATALSNEGDYPKVAALLR